jgi:hypothetical protein
MTVDVVVDVVVVVVVPLVLSVVGTLHAHLLPSDLLLMGRSSWYDLVVRHAVVVVAVAVAVAAAVAVAVAVAVAAAVAVAVVVAAAVELALPEKKTTVLGSSLTVLGLRFSLSFVDAYAIDVFVLCVVDESFVRDHSTN